MQRETLVMGKFGESDICINILGRTKFGKLVKLVYASVRSAFTCLYHTDKYSELL